MTSLPSPALAAWMSRPGDEFLLAEVRLRRIGTGFQLRHRADDALPPDALRELSPGDLRAWAQLTERGAFRPNKFAPGLRRGWRTEAENATALDAALEGLYPGALADWFGEREGTAEATSFREFTGRQTGMYRNTGQLSDSQAVAMVRAGCAPACCLRRRVWTVEGLPPDGSESKCDIPCLEPCALLLEFARRTVRQEQDTPRTLTLGSGDWETLQAALAWAVECPDPRVREGDTSAPANIRRLLRVLERLEEANSHSNPSKEV